MKPFFYALADIEGRPHFDDDCCVAEHPSELEAWYPDDIEEQKLKIVPVYTGPQIEAMRERAEDMARRMIEAVEVIKAIRAENHGQRWSHTLETRMLAVFDSATHAQLAASIASDHRAGEVKP